MGRDRSLDDFLGGSDTEPEDDAAEPENDTVEPTIATSVVDPDGTPCEECGEVVTRRWSDDGQFVCRDCKQW